MDAIGRFKYKGQIGRANLFLIEGIKGIAKATSQDRCFWRLGYVRDNVIKESILVYGGNFTSHWKNNDGTSDFTCKGCRHRRLTIILLSKYYKYERVLYVPKRNANCLFWLQCLRPYMALVHKLFHEISLKLFLHFLLLPPRQRRDNLITTGSRPSGLFFEHQLSNSRLKIF